MAVRSLDKAYKPQPMRVVLLRKLAKPSHTPITHKNHVSPLLPALIIKKLHTDGHRLLSSRLHDHSQISRACKFIWLLLPECGSAAAC